MDIATDGLFLSHPDPMWIYDLETMRFMAVNNAAISKYGYTREEFLAMTIADIRPAEDLCALEENIAGVTEGRDEAGTWRHVLKSGALIHVDITSHTLNHDGRRAELVAARDVSRLVVAEQATQEALAREKASREASETLARQIQVMFASVHGMFLVFSPESFDVIAASEDYLKTMGVTRAAVVGRSLFDVLPAQPDDGSYTQLRDSCDRVLASGATDPLEVQRVLVPLGDPSQGEQARYWTATNAPVPSHDGRLLYLMLRLEDVTEAIHPSGGGPGKDQVDAPSQAGAGLALAAHARELRADNLRLLDLANRLQTTQRLLDTGTWSYAIDEDRLEWSANVYAMHGITEASFGHGFEDYAALVHPEDRTAMRANFRAFEDSGEKIFSFTHRVVHPDGQVVHVQGVAERIETADGSRLTGVVQNATQSIESARALARANRMLEIAGSSARFGAWRYDAKADRMHWSDETARIHDEAPGFSPDVATGFRYYVPEGRDRIEALFRTCLETGEPFNEIFEIITAKGRRLWVRTTGEPERDEAGAVTGLQGSFQDITELMSVRSRADTSESLLEIAGQAARMGGWRVSLEDRKVSWTDGIAVIHELPRGTRPTFERGLDYFAPEDREHARRAFEACARDGIAFDNVHGLITAKGKRIKVRSLGVPVRDGSGKIVAVQGAMQDISELVAARDHSEALARRLRDTLESISDAFMLVDDDWRYQFINAKAEALIHRSRDDLIGKVVWEEYPEAVGNTFHVQYERAKKEGRPVRFQEYSATFGTWLEVNAHPTPEGLAVYFRDFTKQRARDEQLRLLEAAIANINDVVIVTEAGSVDTALAARIVYVNGAFEQLTGFSSTEVIGKTPRILQGPKTQRSELKRIRTALESFEPVHAELINYSKGGDEYWMELNIMPIANADGVCTHFVSIQRDVTERRRAEEALRLSEARFRLVSKATKNAIWDWDVVGKTLWWSDEMFEIFGHRPDPVGSLPTIWRAHVHPEDAQAVDTAMDRLLSGETDSISERYRFRRADGIWTTVEDRAFAIRDEDGRTLRVLGSMMDISEQLRLEERLRQSQKLEAVGQLTGGVAHDFNNLLTVIMGNTEILQDELSEDHPLRRYVEMSATAADRAAELTNRLLAFSRKQALQPQVLDVNSVIAGLEGLLRRTLGEDVDIEIVRAGGLWKTEADLGQLEAALLNLANNARDAMPDGGALTIETANAHLDDNYVVAEESLAAGQYVVISVSDTGHGIPPDQIDRVFEPFFTTKPVGKGTGLGLSMVYGFVKQTGGHIQVYSEPDEGTTFKLYFPRDDRKQVVSGSVREGQKPLRGKETVLAVEDDSMILEQLTSQLEGLGYKVIGAGEGPSALAILRSRPDIDLLLTDVVLPGGMNGRQIADAALAMKPDLKVLFTSGYSENAIVHHGRLDRGVELLIKPYRRATLAAKVRKVLDA